MLQKIIAIQKPVRFCFDQRIDEVYNIKKTLILKTNNSSIGLSLQDFLSNKVKQLANKISIDETTTLPHDVVGMIIIDKMSPIKAWRAYLGKTQTELAKALSISQPTVAKLEKPDTKIQQRMLLKIAKALKIDVEQLKIDV